MLMLCTSPFLAGELPFGCGQCFACRVNKRREWTHRLMIEAAFHDMSSFVTLTYKDTPLCTSICPTHLKNFIKKLRKQMTKRKKDHNLRFFAVGEYGDKKGRPHYHLALFNYPSCKHGNPNIYRRVKIIDGKRTEQPCTCANCQLIYKTWGKGLTQVDRLEKDSAQYVAGYVLDKLNSNELHPNKIQPFARMSNRPGIGMGNLNGDALKPIIDYLESPAGFKYIEKNLGDVPYVLNHGGKPWPLGRYIRDQLRKKLYLAEGSSISNIIFAQAKYSEQIDHWKKTTKIDWSNMSKEEIHQQVFGQRIINAEKRFQLFQKRNKSWQE